MVTKNKSKSVERREEVQKAAEDTSEVKPKKGLKIVYTNSDKKLFDIEDDSPESRKGLFPVQASVYIPGAISYKITAEDLKKYPKLKGVAISGDIVEKEAFDKFVGV